MVRAGRAQMPISSHLPERKLVDPGDHSKPLQPVDVNGRYRHPILLDACPGEERVPHGRTVIDHIALDNPHDCARRAPPAQITPIQALPNELLSEIFHHILQDSPAHGVRPHPHDPVVALTFVCCRWRAVASADRRIWTSIDASYSRTQPANPLTTRRIVSYSGNLPLDLRLWLPSHAGALAEAHAVLCAQYHRWRRVDADVFRFGAFLEKQGATGGMPILEHLCVHNSHTEKEELAYVLPAPRLRSLALHSPLPFVCSEATPWGRLSAYSGPAVVVGSSILHRLASVVETCELVGQVQEDVQEEPVELPQLRALRVIHAAHLRLLVAPGLEVLEVSNEANSLPAIAAFLDRSHCSSLSEFRCGVDMLSKLPAILPLAPGLKTLSMTLDPSEGERLLSSLRACREALAEVETVEIRLAGDLKRGASLDALMDGLADVALAALQRV
ncbi:hypothetical protein EV122DRAFT_250854 [Schizophyllum commune]